MQLETRRFGTITATHDDLFVVPDGIPGFPAMRRVVLIGATPDEHADHDVPTDHGDADTQPMYWLQDLDDGDLAFLCVVPWSVFPTYDLEIDAEELGIADDTDVRVLNLVTVKRSAAATTMSANLRAPIVIDVQRRTLQQVILSDSRWPINQPIAATAGAN